MKIFYLTILALLLTTCKKPAEEIYEPTFMHTVPPFKNILILGNSITRHEPAPQIGWNSDWGMAASSREKDYVHILMSRFEKMDPGAKVTVNIPGFEGSYSTYNLSDLDYLNTVKQDLIIIRLAENFLPGPIVEKEFKKHYLRLIKYLKQNHPNAKVICTSGFWKNAPVENLIREVASETGSSFVALSMLDRSIYTAWNKFTNADLASHPGDKGMQAIADHIWMEIERLLNP